MVSLNELSINVLQLLDEGCYVKIPHHCCQTLLCSRQLIFHKKFQAGMCQRIVKTCMSKGFLRAAFRTFLALKSACLSLIHLCVCIFTLNAYYRSQSFALKLNNRSLNISVTEIGWKCGHYQSSSSEIIMKKLH